MASNPIDPEPSNALGTTDMVFQEVTNNIWQIEKAIWYGTEANRQGERPPKQSWGSRWLDGMDGPEYYAPHEITATVRSPLGIECKPKGILKVKLTDGRTYARIAKIKVPAAVVQEYESGKFCVYLPPLGEPFLVVDTAVNTDLAVSQYKDMIIKEEKVHGNQYAGYNKYEVAGWDPAQQFNLSGYWKSDLLRAEFIKHLTNYNLTPGDYDEAKNRVVYKTAKSEEEVEVVRENALSQFQVVSIASICENNEAIMEKTAKEFAGYKEAYRYRDTYMRPPKNYPENPEQPQSPPQ